MTTVNAKQRAVEIYNQHIALASTDGKSFRKTVMDQLMAETGCTLAAAATHYNNAKKGSAPIAGLGRPVVPATVRKPGSKGKVQIELQPDEECFTVIELLKHGLDDVTIGRCCAHLLQGDASEEFDERTKFGPSNEWVLIKGLGPNHGDTFKLAAGEEEIKRYTPPKVAVVQKEVTDQEQD